MSRKSIAACSIALALLAGCGTVPDVSAVTGATSLQLDRSPVPQGPSVAGFIGETGEDMDEVSKRYYIDAQNRALATKLETSWANENDGARGTVSVAPSPLAPPAPGGECMRYSSVIWSLGRGDLVTGDVCRSRGGPWTAMGFKIGR